MSTRTIVSVLLALCVATIFSNAQKTTNIAQGNSPCDVIRCGYGARCELVDGKGKCVCPTVCPQYIKPICGSNGVTYGNSCFMNLDACRQQEEIIKVYDGECSTTSPPFKPLPTRISPGIGLPKFTPTACPVIDDIE